MHSEQPWFVLSAARHYDLVMPDDPAISHFYSFEADQSNGLTFAIPDGCIDILFDCDPTNPKAMVCGSTLEARSANLDHKHRYFGVRFALGVLPDCLDATAGELVDHQVSLLDLVPESGSMLSQIVDQTEFTAQVEAFRRFYAGAAPRTLSSLTLSAVKAIFEKKGDIRIKQLEVLTGYTCRTLQRRFQGDIGMSPKDFGRIVRCQFAIHNIHQLERIIFSELACDLGFSDQPHFLREFKKFVATTPAAYQRRIQQSAYSQRIRHWQP
jgi:AraC-like DNA-binding protein